MAATAIVTIVGSVTGAPVGTKTFGATITSTSAVDLRFPWGVRYSMFFGDEWNYWAAFCTSFAWVALVLLVMPHVPRIASRLAAVGRTALSNYILDTVLCTTLFYGHGFGLFGKLDRVEQWGVVLAIWVVQLALAPLWLRRFHFGPLEWLWRSLTYWQRQPMRRAVAAA